MLTLRKAKRLDAVEAKRTVVLAKQRMDKLQRQKLPEVDRELREAVKQAEQVATEQKEEGDLQVIKQVREVLSLGRWLVRYGLVDWCLYVSL